MVADDFSELTAIKWEMIVVDEAHRLKNHTSKIAQNLRDTRFKFNHSLLLTGVSVYGVELVWWLIVSNTNP